jgi:adenine/guanine/hypoxanthine permease
VNKLTGFRSSGSGGADGSDQAGVKVPLWTRGDTNAFFGLGFNILVNVLTLTSLLIFVVQVPTSEVLGTVLPALGIALVVGNVYYTYLARRLARRENRTDVTALPYGPSVPHMFIVVFVIMLPIFLATGDPIRAWEAGLAWAFVIGVIVLIGAFIGPYIRRITPRAAMLGTLAGISITFISMRPAAQIWEAAWIGLPVLGIILVGFFTNLRLPGGIPVGLAALLVGTAIGWIGGYMSVPDVTAAAGDIAVAIPSLNIDLLLNGLANLAPLLATAIPLGVYNFAEAMSNVESAAAAGDSYNLRSVLLADGSGAIIGSALGSPFPPAVYIGHPGWKEAGGRASYSMASGVFIAILCFLGLFGLLATVLPIPAIVPILLYIGLLIGAQAFQAVPRIQAAAVVAALIPNIAAWGTSLMDNALAAAGTTAGEVGAEALGSAGLVYDGLKILGEGAVLAGMVLGALVAFILERRFLAAAVAAAVGAVLSWIGLIHASSVAWAASPQVALGYAMLAVVLGAFVLQRRPGTAAPDNVEAGHADAGHVEHAEAGHTSAERSGSASARPATESG